MKPNSKGHNFSENEPEIEENLPALLQVTKAVLAAPKGKIFADVDREAVDRLLSQLQEIIALVEAKRYGLTKRETELWQLRRSAMKYQEIAEVLNIEVNTVKRHMQSIHCKMGL